jgi:AraC-like DNA-binding protein
MYRASSLLRESGHTVAEVAQSVGYDSDGAFHKAFKRVLGVGPGEYRRAAAFEANHVLSTSNGSA